MLRHLKIQRWQQITVADFRTCERPRIAQSVLLALLQGQVFCVFYAEPLCAELFLSNACPKNLQQ